MVAPPASHYSDNAIETIGESFSGTIPLDATTPIADIIIKITIVPPVPRNMRLLYFLPICSLLFITACENSDDDSTVYDNDAGLTDVDTDSFGGWDADRNGMLDENEFRDGDYFGDWDWDSDDDNVLTEDEFKEGIEDTDLFDNFDGNDDDFLDGDEFDFADDWFDGWDSDTDDQLTDDEFFSGMFDEWDANDDGVLDEDEYHNGLFHTWDKNADGMLDEGEFEDNGWSV